MEVEDEVRKHVDELMREELKNLKMVGVDQTTKQVLTCCMVIW